MNEDDIDRVTLRLHDLIARFPLLHTEEGYDWLSEFMHQELDKYCTRDRNYN